MHVTPMPYKFAARLKYQQSITLNPGAVGASAVHVFNANSLYDPDLTTTGHQPRGFDNLMAMYDHYTVIGAKIKAEFTGTNLQTNNLNCFITLKDIPGVSADPNDYLEAYNTTHGVLIQTTGTSGLVKLTKGFSPRKFFHRTKVLTDQTARGTASSSPSEDALWHVGAAPIFPVDAGAINVNIYIEYLAVFTERRVLAQS